MRGYRGYNICPWLKNGKHEIWGKSCREEYCKDHRNKIRNGRRIPQPCLGCGIGVRSQIQLCRGCGREKERQRLAKTRVEPAQHRVSAGVRDKCDTVYFTENEFCFGLRDWTKSKLCLCVYRCGVRSWIQICRGCGREKERQRLYRFNILLQP